ncbi:MAG: hypothetical protein JSU87_17940 [Gemmatimonadota bacterium]|nr:MAG: hypothetical protein JSU87_17940 [Gemmatimonadota bacterium]
MSSDYGPLVDGFAWAKGQALAYAFEGDPVGKWYEAALPGREAFCMRDASHQTMGALALGLAEHHKNMMHKFAVNIAESRDWCSYWEIDRYDRPAPVDYRSDEDFWYNLPANFDVIQACYRTYEWTGDDDYLLHPDFDRFYRRSLTDYVKAWDRDGDGLMESPKENGVRGIPTYWEGGGPRALTGGDLVAAQFVANLAYSRMLALRDEDREAERYLAETERLRRLYNDGWWNSELGRFHTSIIEDGSFDTTYIPAMQIFPLYFGIVEREKADRLFEGPAVGVNVEENSYLAEIHYEYGRDETAFSFLMAQLDPGLERRDYPENPFTAVGVIVRYLVGVNPLASAGLIETRPRLPGDVAWILLEHVPVFENQIGVHHVGLGETHLANETGPALRWRAVFPGRHQLLVVDGTRVEARTRFMAEGKAESYVEVDVEEGATRRVRVE